MIYFVNNTARLAMGQKINKSVKISKAAKADNFLRFEMHNSLVIPSKMLNPDFPGGIIEYFYQ